VIDDGAGLREGIGTGVGLANIRAQLELRYGAKASLTLSGRETGGAEAALQIPLVES
jgi:LytS/YehU family sensor histidine kinase